jgi:hypothetical protein
MIRYLLHDKAPKRCALFKIRTHSHHYTPAAVCPQYRLWMGKVQGFFIFPSRMSVSTGPAAVDAQRFYRGAVSREETGGGKTE